jgi:hypothetical protein
MRPDGRLQDADPAGDLLFQAAAGVVTEFDFHECTAGYITEPSPLLSVKGTRVRPIILNAEGDTAVDPQTNGSRLIETYALVPTISGIIEGQPTGSALLNRTLSASGSSVVGAAVEFTFTRPVQAFGAWILEDYVESNQFVLQITDTTGTTYTSSPLDSGNGSALAVEGFIGAVSEKGIVKAVIEQRSAGIGNIASPSTQDFFYLDHVQIGEGACQDPFADLDADGDVDQSDFGEWQLCLGMTGGTSATRCDCLDRANDGAIDSADFAAFRACLSGPGQPSDPDCD